MTGVKVRIATMAIGIVISLAVPAAAENALRCGFSTGAVTFDTHSAQHAPR